MFEFRRELKKLFGMQSAAPVAPMSDGLTGGDAALLEMLDLALLRAEAKAADVAAGRVSAKDPAQLTLQAAVVWREAARRAGRAIRRAVAPFDTVGDQYREMDMDARRPSRTKSIEELPAALGMVAVYGGDYLPAVLGAANYGRDADSIAVMAGAICAGIGGPQSVPADLVEQVSTASRTPLREWGRRHAASVAAILAADVARHTELAATLASIAGKAQ